jgi:HNH endonuclease
MSEPAQVPPVPRPPGRGRPRYRRSELERLIDRTVLGPTHPQLGICWLFTGTTTPYGRIAKAQDSYTHRLGWKLLRGPIPDGMELHHRCGVYACWNADHLEPVTHAENQRHIRKRTANMAIRCPVKICGSARTGREPAGRATQRPSRRFVTVTAPPESLLPIAHRIGYVNCSSSGVVP